MTGLKEDQFNYDFDQSELMLVSNILEFNSNLIKEGKKLGSGGFGKVIEGHYKCMNFAIKKLKSCENRMLFRELSIMRKFCHPYIPCLFGIIKKPEFLVQVEKYNQRLSIEHHPDKIESVNNKSKNKFKKDSKEAPYFEIVLQLIHGVSLEVLLKEKKLTELEKLVIMLDLASVLEYLHGMLLIHRDLKPANIMINEKFEFKLLDFGISKVGNNSKGINTVAVGTIMYMAPENFQLEILNEEEDCDDEETFQQVPHISNKVDVWGFGCILHEAFSGIKPWTNKAKTDQKILSILYSKVKFEVSSKITNPRLRSIIEKCTQIVPQKRITMAEAKYLLEEVLYFEYKDLLEKSGIRDNFPLGMLNIVNSSDNLNDCQRYHLFNKLLHYIFDYYRNLTRNSVSYTPRFSFDFATSHGGTLLSKNPTLLLKFLIKTRALKKMRQTLLNKYKKKKENIVKENPVTYGKLNEDYIYSKGISCLKTDDSTKKNLNVSFLLTSSEDLKCTIRGNRLTSPIYREKTEYNRISENINEIVHFPMRWSFSLELNGLKRSLEDEIFEIDNIEMFTLTNEKQKGLVKSNFTHYFESLVISEDESDEEEDNDFGFSNENFEYQSNKLDEKLNKFRKEVYINNEIECNYIGNEKEGKDICELKTDTHTKNIVLNKPYINKMNDNIESNTDKNGSTKSLKNVEIGKLSKIDLKLSTLPKVLKSTNIFINSKDQKLLGIDKSQFYSHRLNSKVKLTVTNKTNKFKMNFSKTDRQDEFSQNFFKKCENISSLLQNKTQNSTNKPNFQRVIQSNINVNNLDVIQMKNKVLSTTKIPFKKQI